MEWLICGTVPKKDYPLTHGIWHRKGNTLESDGRMLPVHRGTPALMASAIIACSVLGIAPPTALLVGDTGDGTGSRSLYTYFEKNIPAAIPDGITFHYLFPDVDGHNQVLMSIESAAPPSKMPMLAADAGFMYAAKMSGYADRYTLFTPDLGELAFLADETAPHPFYTRGFLLAEEKCTEELIQRAAEHSNTAHYLLVKGETDYIVENGMIIDCMDAPSVPVMEAIGGTGDLVTGLVTALLASGMSVPFACRTAALTARLTGLAANPSPASQINELLAYIPNALTRALRPDESPHCDT